MPAYTTTLRYLYGLQHRGMKFGLKNTRALLAAVDHPERRFPSIHVGGTNGKGSTAAFLASILMEAGQRTGLYTSPHLVRFTERIRINGVEIDEKQIVEYTERLRPSIEMVKATFFEATTCIGFLHFAESDVDVAVVEVGLGGRLDSTNVLHPLVSIITNISREHTEVLGNTLRSIAREKGGIIKKGVPCVTGASDPAVIDTLRGIAQRKGTRLYESSARVQAAGTVRSGRNLLTMKGHHLSVRRVAPGLAGAFQAQNATLAVAALDVCLETRPGKNTLGEISHAAIRKGLRHVTANTGLRAALETFGPARRYIIDVAHNPHAIHTLVVSLTRAYRGKFVVVFGVMADKEYDVMLALLAPIVTAMVPVRPRTGRALRLDTLTASAIAAGIVVVPGGTVSRGVSKALAIAGKGQKILVTGSHYVAGEAIAALDSSG